MRYVTWSDVVARYPALAKQGQAEETAIESNFISGAEGEVDASLAARYTVPVASTPTLAPPLVRDVTMDLVYYKAAFFTLSDEQATRLWDYIRARLDALSTGSLALVSSAGVVAISAPAMAWSTKQGYENVTGMDQGEDWRVSSVELIDEAARRGL